MLTDQERDELRKKILSNAQEIYAISFEEMDAIIEGSSSAKKMEIKSVWQKIKNKVGCVAGYYSSADDVLTLAKLLGDLGSFGARAYIKTYGGKPHIILRGYPGLRRILTAAKYGIRNPKVVSMGLGRLGATTAAKQGGILTIILLTSYRIIDYLLTDEVTLTRLIGTLATDVVKIGLATGASIAAAAFVAGVTTIAVGPILAVVFVGIAGAYLLDIADKHYGITERVVAGLDEMGENASAHFEQVKDDVNRTISKTADTVIDYTIESAQRIVICWIRNHLRDYFAPFQRIR